MNIYSDTRGVRVNLVLPGRTPSSLYQRFLILSFYVLFLKTFNANCEYLIRVIITSGHL